MGTRHTKPKGSEYAASLWRGQDQRARARERVQSVQVERRGHGSQVRTGQAPRSTRWHQCRAQRLYTAPGHDRHTHLTIGNETCIKHRTCHRKYLSMRGKRVRSGGCVRDRGAAVAGLPGRRGTVGACQGSRGAGQGVTVAPGPGGAQGSRERFSRASWCRCSCG